MTTIAIALGDECIYTYDGTGFDKPVRHLFPKLTYSADLTYTTMYDQANSFVNTVLTGATKLVCSNADGFGARDSEGATIVPRVPAEVKGFATVGTDALHSLIIRLVNAKAVTIPSVILALQETKYYCVKCGVLNYGATPNGSSNRKYKSCGHTVNNAASQAFAMWHTLDSTIPTTP